MNATPWQKYPPLIMGTIGSFISVVCIAYLVREMNHLNTTYGAYTISFSNMLFPYVAKFMTNFERHSTEGRFQNSYYLKIAAFRWVNTAVVITIITPFTATLSPKGGLIASVYGIFFAELTTKTALQLIDIYGHIQRHILAPRAKTQDEMNIYMQGDEVELAERVTNTTMLLFVSLWFCPIYPAALFMASAALTVHFYADKFNVMRTWKRMPNLGSGIAQFSRRYFFSTAIIAMVMLSSFYWSAFPFDHLCQTDERLPEEFHGAYDVGNGETIELGNDDFIYKYCAQTLAGLRSAEFPAAPRLQPKWGKWMTAEQERVVQLFGLANISVIVVINGIFVLRAKHAIELLFRHDYKSREIGGVHETRFSEVENISTFVPQVTSSCYCRPLLACKGYNTNLIDWKVSLKALCGSNGLCFH